MARRKTTRAADDKAAPTQSNEPLLERPACCAFIPLSMSAADIMARIPTGIPAKKTHLHPKFETIRPPRMGPEIAPVPMIVMYSPIALPRSLEGKTSVISAMLFA